MKLKSLLILASSVMLAGTANATLNITERTLSFDQPASMELVLDSTVYLYNVGTQGFLIGANDYTTRASYSTTGAYKVQVQETTEGYYAIVDSVETASSWLKMFADNGESIWVDNNSGANCDAWTITANGDGTYTIANESALASTVLGAGTDGDTRLYLKDASTEGFYSTWIFVSEEEYAKIDFDARTAAVEVYDASVTLLSTLTQADELGVSNIDQYVAVYNNADATVDELEAATAAVNQAITDFGASAATAENPVDMSHLITNATFDTVGDFTGWDGSSFGAGGTTSTCAERYSMTYDTYQQIDNLPNGVYALTVDGFYRAGSSDNDYTSVQNNTNNYALLYAANVKSDETQNDTLTAAIMHQTSPSDLPTESTAVSSGSVTAFTDADGVTRYVPNSMAATTDYINAGYYKGNKVLFAVSENTAKIGSLKNTTISTDWVLLDNFALTYYGAGADAYQLYNDDIIANLTTYSEDDQVTTSVLEAYQAAVESATTATTYEEVQANIATIEAAAAEIEANKAAWDAYITQYETSMKIGDSGSYEGPDFDDLSDYLTLTAEEIIDERALTTDSILAETQKLADMTSDAIQNSITVGTEYDITNPTFSEGETGWTIEAASGGNVAVSASAKCAEGWNNSDWDIYQVVENAPVGAYEISVQGFYREGRGDTAWRLYFDDEGNVRDSKPESQAYVYLNDNQTALANVFDYKVAVADSYYTGTDVTAYTDPLQEYIYPNGMTDAGLAFDQGAYQVSAFGLVQKKGDSMRIGVKGNTTALSDSWAIFTNIKLTYQGKDADIISPELEKALATLEITGVATDVLEQAETLKATGEAALTSGDGDTMFDVLGDIYAFTSTVEDAQELYTAVYELANTVADEVEVSEAVAETKTSASAYAEEVFSNISTYTTEQLEEAQTTLNDWLKQLALPAGYESATDDNPVDLTGLISTPDFDEDGVNSVAGWEGATGYNFGNDDTQKAALALEYYQAAFDMYQDITVPNGTYEVSVKAFNRNGSTDEDYAQYVAGTATAAELYVVTGGETTSVSLAHLASDENSSDYQLGQGTETSYTTTDGLTKYVPNDMVSFGAYRDDERYINSLIVKVTDGTLRIGIKSETYATYGWVIMDEFKLTYYGENSSKEATAVEAVAAEGDAVVKTSIYTIDGIQVSQLQKGVNIIITTDANGNVKAKRVIK